MSITTRGNKPLAADSPLWGGTSANITQPTTILINAGYASQTQPGSANWNWITNYLSAAVTHLFVYGIPIWDTDETYVAGAYLNRNGIIFKSRVGSNIGNTPESSPTEWQDTRSPLPIAIAASGSHNVQTEFNEVLNIDTSGGDIALTINAGMFSGQFVRIISTGGNNTTLTISGHTGTVVLDDQDLLITWDGTKYFISQDTVSKKVVSASGAVVFGPVSFEIELDVSIGNIDIDALDLSDFIGQHVHFYAVGSGIGSIAGGNGVYVNDIFITASTGGAHLWGVDGGLWRVDNGVTADYTSSGALIKQSSSGDMTQKRNDSVGSLSISNNNIGTYGWSYYVANQALSFPVDFSSPPLVSISVYTQSGAGTGQSARIDTVSISAFRALVFSPDSSLVPFIWTAEGDY